MAVREWLQMKNSNFYGDGIFKLVVRKDECIHVLGRGGGGVVVKYSDTSAP
jgi:hypothetical protein